MAVSLETVLSVARAAYSEALTIDADLPSTVEQEIEEAFDQAEEEGVDGAERAVIRLDALISDIEEIRDAIKGLVEEGSARG